MDGEEERLKINSVQKSHSGIYLCTASNFLGNDSKNIVVDVLCKYGGHLREVDQPQLTNSDSHSLITVLYRNSV